MTGLVRKATLLTAAGMLVATAAMAGVPSAANSTTPACITLVGSLAGVPDAAAGQFTVTVRDLANNPLNGASVVIDLSGCADLAICSDQLDANALVNCGAKTTRKFTDATGKVTFVVLGGSNGGGNASTLLGGGKIFANGTLLQTPTVSAHQKRGWDQDAVAGHEEHRRQRQGASREAHVAAHQRHKVQRTWEWRRGAPGGGAGGGRK